MNNLTCNGHVTLSCEDDTLMGELLASWVSNIHDAARDSEGYTDYEDLDHMMDQYDYDVRMYSEQAAVLLVFAEESRRWA